MTDFPKVFIVILNYNGGNFVKKTVLDVLGTDYPNFQIVLVDNHSEDGSFEMLRRDFPNLPLIRNSANLGFASGNNIGIKYSLERGADFVLLLNYDVRTENNFLRELMVFVQKDEKIGLASPLIFKENSQVWFSGGKIDWWRMKALHETTLKKRDYFNSDYLSGCALLVRAVVFEKVGLLDEDYFLYWEDADFSVRAKKAGFKLLLCPQSLIVHLEKSNQKENLKTKTYWLVFSGLLFFQKNALFWQKMWLFFYLRARIVKNRRDLKNKKNLLAPTVNKAYEDFKQKKR